MGMTLQEVVTRTEIAEGDIVAWVEQEWVLPDRETGRWLFEEADVARVSLIRDLREDMAINDEAVPLVLRLLDQVYSLRQAMSEIHEAVQDLPDEHRLALEERLREVLAKHGESG
jgi:chaperone modulatory protein CbpM